MSNGQTAAAPAPGWIAQQASTTLAAAAAMLLGLFIVGMVGFSPIQLVHNAAHDVRHSNGFPCH